MQASKHTHLLREVFFEQISHNCCPELMALLCAHPEASSNQYRYARQQPPTHFDLAQSFTLCTIGAQSAEVEVRCLHKLLELAATTVALTSLHELDKFREYCLRRMRAQPEPRLQSNSPGGRDWFTLYINRIRCFRSCQRSSSWTVFGLFL